MANKILVVVDMQNDFITGVLGNEETKKTVNKVVNLLRTKNQEYDKIVFTLDTHDNDTYFHTLEGEYLPVLHCEYGTPGADLHPDISSIYKTLPYDQAVLLRKDGFACRALRNFNEVYNSETVVEFCGVCTDICVASTAIFLRSFYPYLHIKVHGECCAGTSEELHEAALKVMKSCCIDIV